MMIRRAKPDDLEAILKVFEETIRSTCQHDYTLEQINVWVSSIDDQEKWKNRIANQFFLVAELENKIAGFTSLEGDYIDLLYVSNKFLRKGIANRLFEKLKGEALKNGKTKLASDVSITAYPFFEKMGFKMIRKNHFDLKEVNISNYRMELDLNDTPT
ncbi:MAG: GNAT family N-acetyltransferase [Bacteroidota bacterium]